MHDSDNKTPIEMCEFEFEDWTRDTAENTLELRAYNNYDGNLLFKLRNPSASVELNTTNMVIKIEGNGMTYCFAIDYWYCKQDRYVVHTTNDYEIYFVDWGAVNDLSWQGRVSVI